MKLILLLVVGCLALHDGKGAPTMAVYKFLRCNPAGGQANCVTQQSAQMPWSPELPSKLPASDADSLDAEAVEDESPPADYPAEEVEEDEETPMKNEDGESPGEEGSGYTDYLPYADEPLAAESETGSGESWTDSAQPEVGNVPGSSPAGEAKPTKQDMEDDRLLNVKKSKTKSQPL